MDVTDREILTALRRHVFRPAVMAEAIRLAVAGLRPSSEALGRPAERLPGRARPHDGRDRARRRRLPDHGLAAWSS
jgi:hypothetical protein